MGNSNGVGTYLFLGSGTILCFLAWAIFYYVIVCAVLVFTGYDKKIKSTARTAAYSSVVLVIITAILFQIFVGFK